VYASSSKCCLKSSSLISRRTVVCVLDANKFVFEIRSAGEGAAVFRGKSRKEMLKWVHHFSLIVNSGAVAKNLEPCASTCCKLSRVIQSAKGKPTEHAVHLATNVTPPTLASTAAADYNSSESVDIPKCNRSEFQDAPCYVSRAHGSFDCPLTEILEVTGGPTESDVSDPSSDVIIDLTSEVDCLSFAEEKSPRGKHAPVCSLFRVHCVRLPCRVLGVLVFGVEVLVAEHLSEWLTFTPFPLHASTFTRRQCTQPESEPCSCERCCCHVFSGSSHCARQRR
jgi:hypothetical protein